MSIPSITQTISTPPSPPVAGSSTFDADADACVTYFSTFATETNALVPQINSAAAGVETSRAAAEGAATTATTKAAAAAASATTAITQATSAAVAATAATTKAEEAATSAALAASNAPGWGQEQLVQHHMLGTAAYIDKAYIDGYYTWTPGTIAKGAQASAIILLNGCTMGDFVKASCSSNLNKLQLTGEIYTDGYVRLVLSNTTDSSVTQPASVFYMRVEKLYAPR